MAANTIPAITTGKSQGKGGKKFAAPSRGGKRQVPTPRADRSKALTNISQLLGTGPMQISQEGVPYRYIVPPADPGEDPGYLRPPTQQDIEYGERLDRAQQLKESGRLPGGRDPVAVEQRITAAERQTPTWRDEGDSLRESIYGRGPIKGTLSNVGDMLTSGYTNTLGNMVPFAYFPGGAIHRAGWGNDPSRRYDIKGAMRSDIIQGEGTPFDQSRRGRRKMDLYKHKYYGQPDPGPRPRNVYDDLGMPQPKSRTPTMDVGQGDVPTYLMSAGKGIDLDYGPAKVPPPGSEWGLPAGSLALQGMALDPYLSKETRDLIRSGFPVEDLPPKVQEYIKNTMEKPPSFFDLSGGRGGTGEEEEEGEGRGGIFNILKLLLGMLGLDGLFGKEKKKKKTGGPRQPQRQRIPWQTENRMNQPSYTARQKSITK